MSIIELHAGYFILFYFILFYAGFLAFGVNLWHNKNSNFRQGFFLSRFSGSCCVNLWQFQALNSTLFFFGKFLPLG
jgi:hypothetical protein